MGTVWHGRSGEIARAGNFWQLWSTALIEIDVDYRTDLRLPMGVMQQIANALGGWRSKIEPSMQWSVEREIRLRLKEAFDEAGIEIPFPQQTVWFGDQSGQPANTLSEAEQAAFRARYEQKHAPRPDGDE